MNKFWHTMTAEQAEALIADTARRSAVLADALSRTVVAATAAQQAVLTAVLSDRAAPLMLAASEHGLLPAVALLAAVVTGWLGLLAAVKVKALSRACQAVRPTR